MSFTNKLRPGVHRKSWEMCPPLPAATLDGSFIVGSKMGYKELDGCMYIVIDASTIVRYDWTQDSWMQLAASGIGGTFAAASCGQFTALGMPGGASTFTASAGTTTTLTTTKTLAMNAQGCKIRCVGGTGAGYEGTIQSNTLGNNGVVTVTPASGTAFDATSVFMVWTGALWFVNASTATNVPFRVYDRWTNAWTALANVAALTTWGTSGALCATPSRDYTFVTSTSTGTNTTTTLNDTAATTWVANCWTNYQVRITGGTGKGQVRTIASNTTTALTVGTAWTVTPDATSTYVIEGNDDFLYLIGNAAVTMYRYQISTNTWTTLAPGVARAAAPGVGSTVEWIAGSTDSDWTSPNPSKGRQNGRYIYSFRSGGTSALDVYDIAANSWAAVAYGSQNDVFTTGSGACSVDDKVYLQKDATSRFYMFDVTANEMKPLAYTPYPQSTTRTGMTKHIVIKFIEGGKELRFLFTLYHATSQVTRMMLI